MRDLPVLVKVLLIATVAGQIAYVITLVFPLAGAELVVDAWVSMIAEWTAVVTC